jgi:DNA-binding transcriptional ArsR family regulator
MSITTKAELEELFLRKKPVRLLMALKIGGPTKYVSILSKETDCTYSHTIKLLDEFRNLGLVEFDKAGRVKFIKLTQDGEEMANYFEAILRKFSKLKPKTQPKLKPVAKIPPSIEKQLPPSAKRINAVHQQVMEEVPKSKKEKG